VGRLFLLFTLVPLIELNLLLWIGGRIGFWPTVGIVIFTGMLGASLARAEGLRVLTEWQTALARGEMPPEGVLGGVLVLIGGVLLITPGVITDVLGLCLLLPPTRRAMIAVVRRHLERQIQEGHVRVVHFRQGGMGGAPPGWPPGAPPGGAPRPRVEPPPPGVIDVEGEEVERH